MPAVTTKKMGQVNQERTTMNETKTEGNPNPKTRAGPISLLFFWWIKKIFWKNYKNGLTEEDLYDTLEADDTKSLGDKLGENWDDERLRAKASGKEPSFLKAAIKTFWKPYLIAGIVATIDHLIQRIAQPLLLGYVVQYFAGPTVVSDNEAYVYAAVMLFVVFSKNTCFHHYTYLCTTLGMQVRVACSTLVYRKILRHSKYSMDHSETGKVMNLMTNDVGRFDQAMQYYHFLWLSFVQVAIVTYFLWTYVGVSAIFGFAYIFLATVPVQSYLGKVTSGLRKKTANRTDERMKLMNELISGIQMIKMYTWEKPFAKLVSKARRTEINTLTKSAYIRGFLLSSIVFIERSSLFVTLLAYSLFGNVVMPHQVFAMAQFYNLLNVALAFFYPMAITYTAETRVSLDRIQNFLLKEESKITPAEKHRISPEKRPIGEVTVENGFAKWTPDRTTLKYINLHVQPDSLCAVIGAVGSGKSSLLNALLGELPLTSGTLHTSGKISYSSQEPWIFVGSVRQNILLGQRYDPVRYREVVRVCALEKDFQLFPHADQTLVGARGINLSGGQRARINLARAVYREADIYLMDDPLSAVDAHVGKRMFDNCINGFLKGKTRILVTHQLQYLQEADHLAIMNEGAIELQGSPREIMMSSNNFAKLLAADENDTEDEPSAKRQSTVTQNTGPTTNEAIQTQDDDQKESIDTTTPSYYVVWQYFRSSGNICFLIGLSIALLLGQLSTSASDYWVTYWSDEQVKRFNNSQGHLHTEINEQAFYLEIYGALVLTCIFITLFRSMLFFKLCMRASKRLHDSMFGNILRAPMRFFDTNSVGRILNRFSKDAGAMDELLPPALLMLIQIFLVMIGILVMVTISNYYMVPAIIILGAVFIWLSMAFLSLCRYLRRVEGIKRSPVFSHVTDTINGLTTIRASEAIETVNQQYNTCQNNHTSSWSLVLGVNTALGMWLDIVSALLLVLVTVSFLIIGKDNVSGALVGLAISQAMILSGMLQFGVLQLTEAVSQSISVERILQYTHITPEPPLESVPDKKPSDSWPQRGEVKFHNVYLKYNINDPPVLKNLNFVLQAHHKVGVVGRTGAGKSSLLSALFRLANIEGSVLIDDVDTGTLGLHDLRKCIAIIPQEPVLFSATMRYNLDPFGDFADDALWQALEEVELKAAVQNLDWQVTEGGGNLSVGQRQLVCLARAILRNSRILVLDEATANVDLETDGLIQRTIRRKFKHCTVLTIAHRLNTIMDSDMVLVMDSGSVAEYDHPHLLLQNPASHLSRLVEETSKSMAEKLREMARQAYELKHWTAEGDSDQALNPETTITKL